MQTKTTIQGRRKSQVTGEPLSNWTYEQDWIQGLPEPRKVTLVGTAWVAHAYEIAAQDAELLASRDTFYRITVQDCRRQADVYRKPG
ncbi:MAG TPA: hypothetical protein VEL31_06330 [Ktedonobacteraceae bacterium]|nr:hypothetical protein [Ktedonobacteraceae bacterium]